MPVIGIVKRLQIQRAPMKDQGHGYDLSVLVPARVALVEGAGITALLASGAVMDVHHASHPANYCRRSARRLSIMTVGDYERIRDRFGDHVADGTAGENILVDTGDRLGLDGDLTLRTDAGGSVALSGASAATPCVSFARSSWAEKALILSTATSSRPCGTSAAGPAATICGSRASASSTSVRGWSGIDVAARRPRALVAVSRLGPRGWCAHSSCRGPRSGPP